MRNREYDGLLLDHDGVIVTLASRSTLRTAAAGAFAEVGVSDPRSEDIDAITIGVSPAELEAVAERHSVDPDRLWRCREDRIETASHAAVEAGRKIPYDDVSCLDRLDVPAGIVSNNQTRIVESVLRTYGLEERFSTVRARSPTRESLRRKKPEPTYLEAAATDLGCSNPLYVGDSESDIVAGQRAEVDTAFLRRSHNADRRLETEPTFEATGLEAVVERLCDPE